MQLFLNLSLVCKRYDKRSVSSGSARVNYLIFSFICKEFSGSSLNYKLKQFLTDDGYLRLSDFGLGFVDQQKNNIDLLRVAHFIYSE